MKCWRPEDVKTRLDSCNSTMIYIKLWGDGDFVQAIDCCLASWKVSLEIEAEERVFPDPACLMLEHQLWSPTLITDCDLPAVPKETSVACMSSTFF